MTKGPVIVGGVPLSPCTEGWASSKTVKEVHGFTIRTYTVSLVFITPVTSKIACCRLRKLEELERARKKSDEEMEARRVELLSRDGFYRQRDEQKKKDAALEEPVLFSVVSCPGRLGILLAILLVSGCGVSRHRDI
jgi:hypothetical protein